MARLTLLPLSGEDTPFVEALYSDARVTINLMRIQRPLARRQAREFCEPDDPDEHRFVAVLVESQRPVGLGVAHAETAEIAAIGYSVIPECWGHGYGTEIAARLVDFAFETLGARQVRATTLEDNRASMRVLEKLGFVVREAHAVEIDSRGRERRVTRWALVKPA